MIDTNFSETERRVLYAVAVLGGAGLNGVFLYALFTDRALIGEAMRNPVALVFVLEAFVLMGLLAFLFRRWGVAQLSTLGFLALSLLGGLACSVPVAALWRRASRE